MANSVGIDHKVGRDVRCPTIKLDLTKASDAALLWEMLDDPDLIFCHLAPPCGTSSRARDIRRKHGYDPPKVRSVVAPDGLKRLSATLQKRVDFANRLYQLTADICRTCFEKGIYFSVENPWRSYMWMTTMWNTISDLPCLVSVFSHCMFGSNRAKKTKLAHVIPSFASLHVDCNGQHEHAAWGKTNNGWATSEETAYPIQLCVAMTTALLQELSEGGCVMPPLSMVDVGLDDLPQHKAAAGIQPRGKKLPPLVPHYKQVVQLCGPRCALAHVTFLVAWPIPGDVQCTADLTHIPAGSRVLRAISSGGLTGQGNNTADEIAGSGKDIVYSEDGTDIQVETLNNVDEMKVVVGIPWEAEEFMQRAAKVRHPRCILDGLEPSFKDTVGFLATSTDSCVARTRTEVVRRILSDIIDCKERENEIRNNMPDHCRKMLADKRLALFEKLLVDAEHGDLAIASEMAHGFDMVGRIPPSGIYKKRKRFASLTVTDLRSASRKTRTAIYHSCKGSGDLDMDAAVYSATLDELERGWLSGPHEFSSLPEHSTITRRFGVKQGQKTRPIDNYTESLVNLTSSSGESITLHGVDTICAMLGLWHQLANEGDAQLHLKTCDLHKAYKQLCVSGDALKDTFLAVWNPHKKQTEVYGQYVLPFGSCASVHAFCRTSYALWKIGTTLLRFMWSSYFDDFVIFSKPQLSKHTDFALRLFFQAVGWATSSDKDVDFGPIARVLGMEIDLSESHLHVTVIKNTLERRAELESTIDGTLEAGFMSLGDSQRLRGRLIFAESQVFGRRACRAMGELSRHIHKQKGGVLSPELRDALQYLCGKIVAGPPRRVLHHTRNVMHLYTDACFQADDYSGGIGGVLVSLEREDRNFYSQTMCSSEVKDWCTADSKNPIYELETLAVLVGLYVFRETLLCCDVIVFTDNEGSLGSLISGRSSSQCVGDMLDFIFFVEREFEMNIWAERVHTHSNISDDPSRGVLDARNLGDRVRIDLTDILDRVRSLARS